MDTSPWMVSLPCRNVPLILTRPSSTRSTDRSAEPKNALCTQPRTTLRWPSAVGEPRVHRQLQLGIDPATRGGGAGPR